MTAHVPPPNIFSYFEDLVDYSKADSLHVFSIALCLEYYSGMYKRHSENYRCYCFKCRIYGLLAETLRRKGYQNILFVYGGCNLIVLL